MKMSRSLRVFEISIIRSEKLFNLFSQIVFFNTAEGLLLPADQKATSLFTLMILNSITYCLTYLHGLVTSTGLFARETVAGSSTVTHLSMTTVKYVLNWTKLVVFAVTVVSIGTALALGSTMEGFSPTPPYLALTGLYYITQEKTMASILPDLLARLSLPQIDMQEPVWADIILKTSSLVLAALTIVCSISLSRVKTALPCFIICFYLKARDIDLNCLNKLRKLESSVKRFPVVTASELREHDDVCSVCLGGMLRARKTWCGHIFHPACLAQALVSHSSCPLCKQDIPTWPMKTNIQ